MNEHLQKAIEHQGQALQKRVEFLQNMLNRQTGCLENYQRAIEGLRNQLEAANLTQDALRSEYRKLLQDGDRKDEDAG